MLDRLMENRGLLIGLIAVGVVVMIGGAAGLAYSILKPPPKAPTGTTFPPPPEDLQLTLPPSLEELAAQYPEMATILEDRELDGVYKDFLIAYEEGGIEAAQELAESRGIFNPDTGQIYLTLVVDDPANTAAVVEELEGFGVFVEGSAANEVNIAIPVLLIQRLSNEGTDAHELFTQLVELEHVVRVRPPIINQPSGFFFQQSTVGEGVAITGADAWHAAGITGEGIRIGVLDLGFSGYRNLLGSDLPANVTTRAFASGASDVDDTDEIHGTACSEIVYEMAPGAELFLAYYDGSMVGMTQAVDWLLSQDVDIISHSAGGSYGPMDGSGPDAQLVDSVAAQGVLWVNASGNEAGSHYRGTYLDTNGDNLHEFPNGEQAMPILVYAPFVYVTLNWDAWDTLDQDFELLLYDDEFNLLASATGQQSGLPGDESAEFLYYSGHAPGSVLYVAFESYDSDRAVTFDMFVYPGEVAYPSPPHSLSTPADAAGSLSVGATEFRDDSLASYSSQGPTNDGRLKPEISAPAGVSGETYGPQGFDGTSASTPHVAGAAALVMQANPNYTADDVRNFLLNYAIDYGPGGPDPGFGYGRLNLPDPSTITLGGGTGGGGEVAPTPEVVEAPPPIPTVVPTPGAPQPIEATGDAAAGDLLGTLGVLTACMVGLLCCGGGMLFGSAGLLFAGIRRAKRASEM